MCSKHATERDKPSLSNIRKMIAKADPVGLAQSREVFHEGLLEAYRGSKSNVMQTACLMAVVLALVAYNPAEAQFLGGDSTFPILCTPVHPAAPKSQCEVTRALLCDIPLQHVFVTSV